MRKRKKDKIPLGKRPHGVQNMEPLDAWGIASANLRVFAYKASRSSLTVRITGAQMRRMIGRIVGNEETALDVAIDGLVAISGASFITLVLHVVIEAL
jgi:hypothetical protein